MLTNFQLEKDRFLDIYQFYEYNLRKDRENQPNVNIPLEQEVITQIEKKLMDEGKVNAKNQSAVSGKGRDVSKSMA